MNKYIQKSQEGQSFTKNFPHILKNNRISPLDKLVYAQIDSLSSLKGYCWATNQSLSEMLGTSVRNIQYSITKLIDENFITRILSNNERKLFIVEVKDIASTHERTCTQDMKELARGDERTCTQDMKELARGDERTCTQDMKELAYIIDNRIDKLKDNKLDNIIDNNNTKNLDLVEDMEGVDNITSTNTPEGGYIIPGNDDGNDIYFLIKPEIEIPIDEKIKLNKIKSSIKKEEFDISQRNIEDTFSKEELNALHYE